MNHTPTFWIKADLPENDPGFDKGGPMTTTDANQACLKIYLSYHVSQTRDMDPAILKAWKVGQEIYDKLKEDTPCQP